MGILDPKPPTRAELSATYAPAAGSTAYAAKSVETTKLDVTTAAASYAPVTLGTRQSPILTRKLKGGNLAPKPGGYGWQGLFAEWDWTNWVKPQVDRAIALGLNSIRLIGAPRSIFVDPVPGTLLKITQAQYDAHWAQLAEYCLRNGLYLYPCLCTKWDFIDTYGLGANFQDTPMTDSIKTTAGVLGKYSNVIGFDVFQEGDANTGVAWQASKAYSLNTFVNNGGNSYKVTTAGTSAASGGPTGTGAAITDNTVTWAYQAKALLPADVIALMNGVRMVANLPITMSRTYGDGFGWTDTTSMWHIVNNTVGGSDFLDMHFYLDGVLPGDPDFMILKSGKPFLIGEFGSDQSLTTQQQTARYTAAASLHNRRGIIGSFVWALADQVTSGVPSQQYGIWDNTGFAQSWPAPSTAPLSVTAGKRTHMTNVLPQLNVADKIDVAYRPQNMLSAAQARVRNANTIALAGWTTGANTSLYLEPRGLGIAAVAIGTTIATTAPATSTPATGATYYQAKVTMLAGATARAVSMNLDWYDSAGAYISSSTTATGTDSSTIPLVLNLLVRSHANTAYVVMVIRVTDAAQAALEAHIVIDAEILPVA